MQSIAKKRIGILRGGTGKNYASSLQRGGDIIFHIGENFGDKYKTFDILIDRGGVWHFGGVPINPGDLVNKIDMAWNTTHSSFANTLENLSIPNISAGAFASGLENSKELLREHMQSVGIEMPRRVVLPLYQKDFDGPRERYAIKKAKEVFEKFAGPWIVKAFTPDSSMGIHLAKTFNELVAAIEDGVKHDKSILVEEFIAGKVASVHALSGFRKEAIYTFPLGNTFDQITREDKELLVAKAKDIHKTIGVKHYLKADFILDKRGKIYLLGIELSPDLREESHFSQVCGLVGVKPHHIVEHILENNIL